MGTRYEQLEKPADKKQDLWPCRRRRRRCPEIRLKEHLKTYAPLAVVAIASCFAAASAVKLGEIGGPHGRREGTGTGGAK